MLDPMFSEPGHVFVEGPYVLRLIKRFDNFAEYFVLGFKGQVILRDFRYNGLKAIDYVLNTQDTSYFSNDFIGTAQISVYDLTDKESILIELKDTFESPQFLLWIIVGFDGYIPAYEYKISLVQMNDESEYAFVAIINIDENEISISDYSSSSELTRSLDSLPLRSCEAAR